MVLELSSKTRTAQGEYAPVSDCVVVLSEAGNRVDITVSAFSSMVVGAKQSLSGSVSWLATSESSGVTDEQEVRGLARPDTGGT